MLLQDVIQQLKQKNESLQQQLQQQHGAAGPDQRSSSSTPQANGTAGPTTTNNSNSSSGRGPSSKGGILDLNVSGTALTTSLAALQQVRGAFFGGGGLHTRACLLMQLPNNCTAQQLQSLGRD